MVTFFCDRVFEKINEVDLFPFGADIINSERAAASKRQLTVLGDAGSGFQIKLDEFEDLCSRMGDSLKGLQGDEANLEEEVARLSSLTGDHTPEIKLVRTQLDQLKTHDIPDMMVSRSTCRPTQYICTVPYH